MNVFNIALFMSGNVHFSIDVSRARVTDKTDNVDPADRPGQIQSHPI